MSTNLDLEIARLQIEWQRQAAQQSATQVSALRILTGTSSMGMGQATTYTPPPPPKVKYVGGDHPWSMMPEPQGSWPSILYRDLLIPHARHYDIMHKVKLEEWDAMSIAERMEYVYLEARKLLIVEG